jgi:phosphate starvation-inducible PhoH-like protein
MKMFLTRIGFGSKVIITGDRTQKDLSPDVKSGLDIATDVLKNIDDIAFCNLTSADVVRHPLVQKIVRAYEEYENKDRNKKVKKNIQKLEKNRQNGK